MQYDCPQIDESTSLLPCWNSIDIDKTFVATTEICLFRIVVDENNIKFNNVKKRTRKYEAPLSASFFIKYD